MRILSDKLVFILLILSFNNFGIKCYSQTDTVHIAKQIWMSKNLNVSTFRNGDTIIQAESKDDWLKAAKDSTPAWCYYNNDSIKGNIFGKLYNWYAVNDKRGLAPNGWRIPDEKDFNDLVVILGKNYESQLASKQYWIGNWGNNNSGFNSLPGGIRSKIGFGSLNTSTFYWTLNSFNKEKANAFSINAGASGIVFYYDEKENKGSYISIKTPGIVTLPKLDGLSVRCIKE
jgi:uncharacterized protein (TIGR02145 family)